jgi:hypothetical protein
MLKEIVTSLEAVHVTPKSERAVFFECCKQSWVTEICLFKFSSTKVVLFKENRNHLYRS